MRFSHSQVILSLISWGIFSWYSCEYEVTEPAWYQPYSEPPVPLISTINPPVASAGWNYITIKGQNFIGDVKVYFDNTKADIVSFSHDSIKVRRPNIGKDSCYVKVVCDSALVVARYGPYRVAKVIERYGNFLENKPLNVAAVDQNENLYVVDSTKNIYKITPVGDKTLLGLANRTIYDAAIGPDGNLYLLGNNRSIDAVNVQTGAVTEWKKLNSGKVVKYGDFDVNGYFYAGGRRSGLVIVAPNKTETDLTLYSADEITGIRVYKGYLYLSVITANPDASNPRLALWRHALGSGTVGGKELVLDLTRYEDYGAGKYNSFYFGADGLLYLGLNAEKPLLVVDVKAETVDYLYLGIVPSYCRFFTWGNTSYIYLIRGDTNLGAEWTLYRIDLGVNVGPKN